MSIVLKNVVKIVIDVVDVINKWFLIKWEDIVNKLNIDVMNFYMKEEIGKILNVNN